MNKAIQPFALLVLLVLGSACSDSNSNRRATPAPPPPNTQTLNVDLASVEVIGGGAASGSASASFVLNLDDQSITGTVTLTGIDATAVQLVQGFAGETGAVVIDLDEDSATQWSIPDSTVLSAADVDALNAGGLHITVKNTAFPDGALRGQILVGNIELYFAVLSGEQQVPPLTTTASAVAAITLDPASGAIVVHLNSSGADDAVAAHVHEALAGLNGPVLIELAPDPNDPAHWFAEDDSLDGDGLDAFNEGALYLNLHTPANPGGEVRGQIVPPGIEVVFTALAAGDVVPPSSATASGVAASTLASATMTMTTNVNLVGLDDADAVAIRQAPVGQNGPDVFNLSQNPNELSQWQLDTQTLDDNTYAALNNRGLYVEATAPGFPDGAVRGQIEPEESMTGPGDAFVVVSTSPANGATVSALPGQIDITLNRAPADGAVDAAQFAVTASGGDGSFNDGNELNVNIASVSNTSEVIALDLTGANGGEDTYRISLDPEAGPTLTDGTGLILDGDEDGNPGGTFASTFEVAAGNATPTLTEIQTNTFTPSCAVSGCHAGASPAQGMDLSAGNAFSNIVGVPSNQVPNLNRIEPFDANASYLVDKIEGNGQGSRMPLGGSALPNEEIQAIRDWVDAGAEDN